MGRRKTPGSPGEKLPSGVTLLPNGRYRVRITFEGRQYEIGSWQKPVQARAALDRALLQKAAGTFVPPAKRRKAAREEAQRQELAAVTLLEWSHQWLELLASQGRTESTIVSYRSLLNAHILPVLGQMRLQEVTPDHVRNLVSEIQKRPSVRNPKATSNGVAPNVVRTLRSCFNDAVEREIGGLTVSPVRMNLPTRKVRAPETLGEVASPQEVWELYDAMPEHMRLAVLLAGFVGLRIGEVLGLERRDFEGLGDPDNAWLHIERQANSKAAGAALTPPKAGSVRTNSIPAVLVPIIVDHLEKYVTQGPESPLFPSRRTENGRISQTSFDNTWRKARATVDRSTFRFHALRATALTLYGRTGATDVDLMRRGGHKTYDVAMAYQHSGRDREQQLTASMNDMIQR